MLRFLLIMTCALFIVPYTAMAAEDSTEKNEYEERMSLYKSIQSVTHVPWTFLAAVDQYEKHIHKEHASNQFISITIPIERWAGPTNPSSHHAQEEDTISIFNGLGKDGDGDGIADQTNDLDILYTMASYLSGYGTTDQDLKIAVWNYYQRDLSVQAISNNAKVFETFQTVELTEHRFPVPLSYNYSYRSTWGDARGFGGRRIHEGTDIFANYGVPVRATAYGVVEMKGWNRYGGWRIGIRDTSNTYHYFAHLNGFEKGVKPGQVVKPGDVVGYVGATGYGPPGTSGKFPPHLHYGMYRDNGHSEWSYDPYPHLRAWERETRKLLQK
ncbi:peptidase M23 [Pontibacillus halophilus JSM 076056 = DSM 19796]|uniref:Peptidase M23 n=2 Tax=Pontibacillus TaxID=289201 RepID=A0A0A5GCA1_9BACI|nr:peptidase M23 [Pontibacillus halophilus JSM 076056 = DSM 19796]